MTKFFKVTDLETLRAWCSLLMSDLKDEAKASLREENVLSESMLLFQDEEGTYFVRGEMKAEGEILPANMQRRVNVIHRYVLRRCMEPCEEREVTRLEVLYEVHA